MKPEALELRGLSLEDPGGDKVGEIVDFYFDAGTDEPEWLAVEAGLLDKKVVLAPMDGISRDGDRVTTPYPKDHVMDAPQVEGPSIDRATERALYEYYHLRRELPGRTQERAAFEQDRGDTGDARLRSWNAASAA